MPSTLPAPIDKLAIVVVTYKRQELLANLFDSMTELTATPWRIVIVDNENSRETEAMCAAFNERLANLWGIDTEQPDAQGGTDRVIYAPQLENGGGAGGFSAGTKCAYDLGAQWFWVMDDDVLVIPEGIERLAKWTDRYDVIQGSRLDFDGGYRAMNQLCFEGGMFSRRVVDKIGLPDARFFIYGDDACYGYVASQHFPAAVVADVVLKRARAVSNWDIAGKRQLNSTSDTNRYYIMRNRGYLARYMQIYGDYHPALFRLGNVATFCKEFIRLAAVDKCFKTGIPALRRGMKDARKIVKDPNWKPMPPMKDTE